MCVMHACSHCSDGFHVRANSPAGSQVMQHCMFTSYEHTYIHPLVRSCTHAACCAVVGISTAVKRVTFSRCACVHEFWHFLRARLCFASLPRAVFSVVHVCGLPAVALCAFGCACVWPASGSACVLPDRQLVHDTHTHTHTHTHTLALALTSVRFMQRALQIVRQVHRSCACTHERKRCSSRASLQSVRRKRRHLLR